LILSGVPAARARMSEQVLNEHLNDECLNSVVRPFLNHFDISQKRGCDGKSMPHPQIGLVFL
jgi:hypothetical protein